MIKQKKILKINTHKTPTGVKILTAVVRLNKIRENTEKFTVAIASTYVKHDTFYPVYQ